MRSRLVWLALVSLAALVVVGTVTAIPGKPKAKRIGNGVTAYAYVIPGEVSLNVSPVLVSARTRNFDRVSEPAAGVYCLHAAPSVDAAGVSWAVTPEASRSGSATKAMFAYADAGSSTCPAGWLGVRTYELRSGPVTAAVPSEHVAFMLVAG